MSVPKIIVLGSLNGQLQAAFAKLATLHLKNKFDLALLTGDVFTSSEDDATVESLLRGDLKPPLPTYFISGSKPFSPKVAQCLADGRDLCENLHFLNDGILTTTSGVRIAAAADRRVEELPDAAEEAAEPMIDQTLYKGSADVLLTTRWPKDIWRRSTVDLGQAPHEIPTSVGVADLVQALKPRYHFTTSAGNFFEREPFVLSGADDQEKKVIRFVSMATFGNDRKQKSLYAFTLPPVTSDIPLGSTGSPFISSKRRAEEATNGEEGSGSAPNGYSRFSNEYSDDRGRRGRGKRRRFERPTQEQCFFCLSNPNISTHMCCSIAEETYLTVAKGPLTTAETYKEHGLSFPGHLLIIPLAHEATVSGMGSAADAGSDAVLTHREMERFRDSLQAMVASRSNYKLGAVTWEISRQENVHVHWQFMAVPADKIKSRLVETAFRVEAENQKLAQFASRELTLEEQVGFGDYFRVWIWADDGEDKIKGQSLVMPLDPRGRFDLQFGRRVLAKLLNLENRLSWRDCPQTIDEEKKDVAAFQAAFREWDFTLQ